MIGQNENTVRKSFLRSIEEEGPDQNDPLDHLTQIDQVPNLIEMRNETSHGILKIQWFPNLHPRKKLK